MKEEIGGKMELEDIDVDRLCTQIRTHASETRNEEELKIRIESTLRPILDRWGIQWATYEHSHKISGMRKGALYGTVIIEYKAPLKLDSKRDFEKGKEQVKQYISEEVKDPQYFGRYFGILLDGYKIAFIRYRRNEWEEPDLPVEISPRTILRVLEAIRGLKRKPIDAEELLRDFGPQSALSKDLILKVYRLISNPHSSRSLMLFEDWRRVFSQVCACSKDKMAGLIKYYGVKEENVDTEKLMFSVHTYYTLLMKLVTSEIVTLFADNLLGSYLKRIEDAYYKGPGDMLQELKDLEEGGIFNSVGIKNFLEADYFAWYLDEWDDELASHIHDMVTKLLDYEPATVELNPELVRDLFKHLYQNLVPRDIRHSLGEYFTPDWLARLLLDEVGYYGEPDKSLLDPACGSGTFLVLAIRRIRDFAEERFMDKRTLLESIVNNVKGVDLNPLAVQATKANYLIALSDLLRYRPREGIEIPVYLADSIFVSRKKTVENRWEVYLKTTQGEFWIPHDIIDRNVLAQVLSLIETCIKNKYTKKEFESVLTQEIRDLHETSTNSLMRLYGKIQSLEKNYMNKIWVRLLKNSFAPLLMGKFDFVVGNPPWINWENLPQYYREETKNLWDYYGLLEKTEGMGLGKVKRDMAMMFTARCLDRYVKDSGRYAFLIPFTVFKSQTGAGFRRFLAEGKIITPDYRIPCKVVKVHDLVELYPFEGVVNRTAMFVIEKNEKTQASIPCIMWHNPSKKGVPADAQLDEIERMTKQFEMIMEPIKENKTETPWMTGTEKSFSAIRKVVGESPWYSAHAGVYTGLNQVYWVEIISDQQDGLLITNPQLSGQKSVVKQVKHVVERELVYPLIRGRNVRKWYTDKELSYIALPVDEKGKILPHTKLRIEYPKSYDYFMSFFENLVSRSSEPYKSKLKIYKEKPFELAEKKSPPFYWLFNVSHSTSPYKVIWKEIAGKISGKAEFMVAVIGSMENPVIGKKYVIPDHKIMFIPFYDENEAHYVASILNSSISRTIVATYTIETTMDTHVMNNLHIPGYNPQDPSHQKLSELSKKAHKTAKKIYEENRKDLEMDLKEIEVEIDENVAELYGITDKELKEIKKTLMILKEGEMPEEETEFEETLPSGEVLTIKVDPLLIEEKGSNEITVTLVNNTDDSIRNITLTLHLQDSTHEYHVKKIRAQTSEDISFSSPALTQGQYNLTLSVVYTAGKEEKTFTDERLLYVKEKEKSKEELEDLFR